MKKILIMACLLANVVIAVSAARQGTVGFDAPDIMTGRDRLKVEENFKAQNKDICPEFLKLFNRLYHVERSRDGKGYATAEFAKEQCEKEQKK